MRLPDRALRLLPYLLALLFAIWSLRGAAGADIADPDAARHAMNGAFLHDLVRDGGFVRAMDYAKTYYGRLPALSIPYHPPLFPLVESVFFFGLGVNVLAARLVVALAVALSAILLYRLVLRTHASHGIAFASTATFLAINGSQRLAADVMLEFPALALTVASLYFVRDLERFTLRRALAFALVAGAAVWTKQNAVFLGAVPFAYAALARRRRVLLRPPVWIAAAVFGAAFVSVLALSRMTNLTTNTGWPKAGLAQRIAHHVPFYSLGLVHEFGPVLAILSVVAAAAYALLPRRTGNDLYVAWAASGAAVVLVMPPADLRYQFFIYPALLVLAYAALAGLARAFAPAVAWAAPAVACALWFLFVARVDRVYLHGPSDAARTVLAASPRRILYCGRTNGAFIFTVRSLDPALRTAVIRGDKLPKAVFTPAAFQAFAHELGIEQIVIERNETEPRQWDDLYAKPLPSMELVREIPLRTSEPRLRGRLRVFRFTNPSCNPKREVTLKMMSGAELKVGF